MAQLELAGDRDPRTCDRRRPAVPRDPGRAACRPSRARRASSGSGPTSRSCSPAARPPRSIRRPRPRTSPSSSPTPARSSSSPRTTHRSPSCASSGTHSARSRRSSSSRARPTVTGSSRWTTSPRSATRSSAEHPAVIEEIVATLTPDHLATLVYTSGTTGRPKGVELTHAAWTYEGAAVEALNLLRSDLLQFLWLPLSHVFGKVLLVRAVAARLRDRGRRPRRPHRRQPGHHPADVHGCRAAHLREGLHADRVDDRGRGRPEGEDLRLGVPASVSTSCTARPRASPIPPHVKAQHLVADKLVFSKIRHRLGGRIEYFVSGPRRCRRTSRTGSWPPA